MRKVRGRAGILAGVLLACCACAPALDPSLDISQYAHTAWKSRDGLVRGYVGAIEQTPDGYLWLGTEFGLYRFDGVRAVPWQPPAGQQLPDTLIASLLVARDGALWIGTLKGLATWKDGNLKTYSELSGQSITALVQDREGTIWIGSSTREAPRVAQLCSARGDHLECHGGDGTFGPMILSLYEGSKGNLWAGVAKGLWRWKPGVPEFVASPQSVAGITGFAEDDEGAILVGNSASILRLVDGRLQPYPLTGSSRALAPQRLLRDHDGGLWVGSFGFGLAHIHRGRVDTFSEADGLSGGYVVKVFEDREGNVWAGTMNGLDRFREYAVPNVSVKQGLSNGVAVSLLAANDGSIWIATSGGFNVWKNGYISFVGARFGSVRAGGRLNSSPPASLFQDSTGRIFIATRSGFGYLENGRYVAIRDFPAGDVLDIVEGAPGHLWVATQYAGLLHFFNAKIVEKVPWAALGHKDIGWALVLDPSRAGIWIGFVDGGIAYFTGGRIQKQYSGAEAEGGRTTFGLDLGARSGSGPKVA
jgi:ligand-binding sensor domain-containing protein